MGTYRIHLNLDLDWGEEPIAGRFRRPDGSTRGFVGWLELARAIDDARQDAGSGQPDGNHLDREP